MSHNMHAVQHEVEHRLEHDEKHGGGHGHGDANSNKRVALLISVLALFLALSETLGKSSQTSALNFQIEASNLWNFFQAKNIRRTTTIIAAEVAKIEVATVTDEARKAALQKQVGEWEKTAARYQSEPEAGGGKGEGTRELSRRALETEKLRDRQLDKYHNFEFASAAFQIGIVLCSAAVITTMLPLVWAAIAAGLLGVLFTTTGFVMPSFPHDILHMFESLFSGGGHH